MQYHRKYRHKQKLINNVVFTKTEQRLYFLMRILVLINKLLIFRLMSALSVKLSLLTCPKYLNCDAYCSDIPTIVNTRKERDIILSRRLGVKIIGYTVFLKLHVTFKSKQCLSNLSKSNCRAAHLEAEPNRLVRPSCLTRMAFSWWGSTIPPRFYYFLKWVRMTLARELIEWVAYGRIHCHTSLIFMSKLSYAIGANSVTCRVLECDVFRLANVMFPDCYVHRGT